MPLHWDESCGQANLSFKNHGGFVEENHHSSREQLLETIKHLSNRFNILSHANFAIYVLDDYAVHLMPEVRQGFWNRGYILVIIGGGITGFAQVIDTHLHKPLKSEYRKKESKLMLEKITKTTHKKCQFQTGMRPWDYLLILIKMLRLMLNLLSSQFGLQTQLKGSEDYLVSDKIFGLNGESMTSFRTEIIAKPPPKSVKELITSMIPPEGIKKGKNTRNWTSWWRRNEEWCIWGRWWKWSWRWTTVGSMKWKHSNRNHPQETVKEGNSVIGKTVSCWDNRQWRRREGRSFPRWIQKVFDSFQTPTQFTSARQQIETAYQNVRANLKKRIKNEVWIISVLVWGKLPQLLIFKIFSYLFPHPRLFGTIEYFMEYGWDFHWIICHFQVRRSE